MDRVRLGRALGFGARQAVKTMVRAVDAATAESPSTKAVRPEGQKSPVAKRTETGVSARQKTSATVAQAKEVRQGVKRGSKRFGEAVWNPFVRLSGVLWLEVMGVFFGIFALFALGAVWRLREAWHGSSATPADRNGLFGAMGMLVLFGYFCVSSFVRARRRERRR